MKLLEGYVKSARESGAVRELHGCESALCGGLPFQFGVAESEQVGACHGELKTLASPSLKQMFREIVGEAESRQLEVVGAYNAEVGIVIHIPGVVGYDLYAVGVA